MKKKEMIVQNIFTRFNSEGFAYKVSQMISESEIKRRFGLNTGEAARLKFWPNVHSIIIRTEADHKGVCYYSVESIEAFLEKLEDIGVHWLKNDSRISD